MRIYKKRIEVTEEGCLSGGRSKESGDLYLPFDLYLFI